MVHVVWQVIGWVLGLLGTSVVLRAVVGWAGSRPAASHGDELLVPLLDGRQGPGAVACAVVDARGAAVVVRQAFRRCDARTPFEVGSISKTFTGLLLADAIRRGEVSPGTRLDAVWPELAGSPSGEVSLDGLAHHTSGLPRLVLGRLATLRLAAGAYGLDPYRGLGGGFPVHAARGVRLRQPGDVRYSNLGAALVGSALVARARPVAPDYASLLSERILQPMGMDHTSAEQSAPRCTGHDRWGVWAQPWRTDAYAPAGGVVSTLEDMCRYADRLLQGSAPGQEALTEQLFWQLAVTREGRRRFWHNGQTGGFSSYLAIYPDSGLAVVVLAATAHAPAQERLAVACVDAVRASSPVTAAGAGSGPVTR